MVGIYQYGLVTWAEEIADRYWDHIHNVIIMISENPAVGRARDSLQSGMRSFPVEQHIVFYRSSHSAVLVVAVLHSSVDVERQFQAIVD